MPNAFRKLYILFSHFIIDHHQRIRSWSLFYILVLAIFMLSDHFLDVLQWNSQDMSVRIKSIEQMFGMTGLLKILIFYCTLTFATLPLLLSRNRYIRSASFGILFFFISLDISYQFINSSGFSHAEATTMLYETKMIGSALTYYTSPIIKSILVTILLTAPLIIIAWRKMPKIKVRYGLVAPCLILLYILTSTTGKLNAYFPALYRIPCSTYFAFASKERFQQNFGARTQPKIRARNKAIARQIVMIVDETVRGDHLGINGNPVQTTPFLDSIKEKYFNFGIACAASNLSSSSNIIMQTGIRLQQLPSEALISRNLSTIFQYAKQAQLQTRYIDGQILNTEPQNFMRKVDFKYIDQFHPIRATHSALKEHEVDYKIIETLKNDFKSSNPSFTYIVKNGSHFAYDNKYPPDLKFPFENADYQYIDPAIRDMLKHYHKAIYWGVDRFVKRLYEEFEGTDTIIIYTSDHGESFFWYGGTHGWPKEAGPEQANVPLLIFPMNMNEQMEKLQRFSPDKNLNRASHFQVFPTLLSWFGFDESEFLHIYGDNLAVPNQEKRFFFSGDVLGQGEHTINAFDDAPAQETKAGN